jgi:hypothetical protein
VAGARAFRRHLATEAVKRSADVATFRAGLGLLLNLDVDVARSAA